MVTSYVKVSRHSRLPRALQAKGRSAPLRHVTKNPSPQLLLFPTLTNRDSRNSFRIRSYKKWRVSLVFSSQPLDLQTFRCAFCIPNGVAGRSDVRIPVSALDATLTYLPASVANKRLTSSLSLLDATLTKNRGGVHPSSQEPISFRQTFHLLLTSLHRYFITSCAAHGAGGCWASGRRWRWLGRRGE